MSDNDETDKSKLNDGLEFANRAVHFDKDANYDGAVYYYDEAAKALDLYAQSLSITTDGDKKKSQLLTRVQEYRNRSYQLQKLRTQNQKHDVKSLQQIQTERSEFLLHQALDEDMAGNSNEAAELYAQAVELCLETKALTSDETLQNKLKKMAEQALDRAEVLKGITTKVHSVPVTNTARHAVSPVASRSPLRVSGNDSYSKEELEVLRLTSVINGREYVPFMTMDLNEKFAYPLPFCDKDGLLTLSPKQKTNFQKWVRPHELSFNPCMINNVNSFNIKQTVVSDCSFVASLAISGLFEKRYSTKLVTGIIYPQNKNGDPVYNPCGKYTVRLNINGVPRKVIIDDRLPIGKSNELLCSYSCNHDEFWVSLLEKAYMKVMGGYDFPGSNSNIDLHALTSWIPERVAIRMSDPEFNKDKLFQKIRERFHKGDVMVTMATGDISEIEADRTGLVPTHAYAMLDIQEVGDLKLLMIKNPWSHLRWKGNYSERDTIHWTENLKSRLNYDPKSAQNFDNGVFWIDLDSICRFFDVVYMNWSPALFKFTYCVHETWSAALGPIKDVYNIGENPQYALDIKCAGNSAAAVWVLLTRHIVDKADFAENKEYITVLVYKNNGKRVYYPYDPPPYIDGTRINSPHYLSKMVIKESTNQTYNLVISQYEKSSTIHYTLRVYSTCPFNLRKIVNPYKHKQEVTCEWKGATAGGCGNNHATYKNNPIYQLQLLPKSVEELTSLLIELKAPKEFQVGFDVTTVSLAAGDSQDARYFAKKSSGSYRSGYVLLSLDEVLTGTYNITPSTFYPGFESPFFLKVNSSSNFKLTRIQ